MSARVNQILAAVALFVERFVLSIVFFCLAASELMAARQILKFDAHTTPNLLQAGNHIVLLFTGLFSSLMLLLARRAVSPPRNLKLILVPLATTFFYLAYFAAARFPESLKKNLAPVELQPALLVLGFGLVIIGHLIAFWGILYLGRSFGVVVAVRKVVLRGPYRWVRHPMYLGWVIFCAGISIANFSIAYFLIIAIHISLLVYRARLEESEIAEHSPEYRAYMQSSGFIFPRLGRTH